jgi:predicted amidohydrolase YtcJ
LTFFEGVEPSFSIIQHSAFRSLISGLKVRPLDVRCGLTKQQAIEVITRNNAGILGVNKILGTLEKGKWASFVCWNGDPFELSNYPVRVVGEGQDLIGDIVKES